MRKRTPSMFLIFPCRCFSPGKHGIETEKPAMDLLDRRIIYALPMKKDTHRVYVGVSCSVVYAVKVPFFCRSVGEKEGTEIPLVPR